MLNGCTRDFRCNFSAQRAGFLRIAVKCVSAFTNWHNGCAAWNRFKEGRPLSPIYRKGVRADALWHCCENCRGWPTEGYEESERLAMGAVLCHICRAKLRNGTCCRDAITVPEIEDRLQAAAASSRPLIFR